MLAYYSPLITYHLYLPGAMLAYRGGLGVHGIWLGALPSAVSIST